MKKVTLFLLLLLTQSFISINAQNCNAPSNIHLSNYPSGVRIRWTNNNASNEYDLEYGISGFTHTGVPIIENHPYSSYYTNDLSIHSEYIDFYIRADCGAETSEWVGPFTFYNYCTFFVPAGGGGPLWYEESFQNDFIPYCWSEANQGNPTSGISGFNSSHWNHEYFANDATNSMGAKINIQETQTNDWLVMPMFRSLYYVKGAQSIFIDFDMALTQQNSTAPASLGSDDQIQLVISDDLGVSWYNVRTWDTNSSISNTGQSSGTYYNYGDGADFKLHTFLLAFWASSGDVNDIENIDFHIDNIYIDLPYFGGVAEELTAKGFKYFPNPAENFLNISAKETIDTVIFYDVLGRKLKTIQINFLQTQLDISDLVEGNYIMKVKIGNTLGSVFVYKN